MASIPDRRSVERSLRRDAREREKQLRVSLVKEYAVLKVEHPELGEGPLVDPLLARRMHQQKIIIERNERKEAIRRQKARDRNAKVRRSATRSENPSNTSTKVLRAPSGNLPDWDETHRSNDVFSHGCVVSGGGYGLGKSRKH